MSNQKGNIPIFILSILLAIAVVIAGYLYWHSQQLLAKVSIPQVVTQPTNYPTTKSNLDTTANWKLYADEIKGISIKYPPHVYKAVENKDTSVVFVDYDPAGMTESDIVARPWLLSIDKLPPQGFGMECVPKEIRKDTVTLANGQTIDLTIGQMESNALCGPKLDGEFTVSGSIVHNGDNWLLGSQTSNANLDNQVATLKEMLSTFKFLN